MTLGATVAKFEPVPWQVCEGEGTIGVRERPALGTLARLVAWPSDRLDEAAAAVDRVLEALDRQASRFRPDSELSRVQRSARTAFLVSVGLADALDAALRAACWTGGLVDPTVGSALVALGYDRDFSAIDEDPEGGPIPSVPAEGWAQVRLRGSLLDRPPGIVLDLGATAKGLGADRAAAAAYGAMGRTGGVLVSLGGDLSVAGVPPRDGWPVVAVEDPGGSMGAPAQVVRLSAGALATSSVVCRMWRQGQRTVHHLVDPRTGTPANGPWRTATVAAANCLTANAASTAVMVGGAVGVRWLEDTGLPARLVGMDGSVRTFGSWPQDDWGTVGAPRTPALALPPGTEAGGR